MSRYSTFVFDVGGTLLRFNLDGMSRAFLDAAAAMGVALDFVQTRVVTSALEYELPLRTQERLISLEEDNGQSFWDGFYGDGFRRLGVKGDVSAAAAGIRERFQCGEFEMLFDDVIPTLEALTARGAVLGILSNFSNNCEDVLRKMNLHRYFSFFVVSAIAGVEKPDPRIFELAIQAANRPRNEIVYIGDSIYHDMDGARGAGIDAILVDRENRHSEWKGCRVPSLTGLVQFLKKE